MNNTVRRKLTFRKSSHDNASLLNNTGQEDTSTTIAFFGADSAVHSGNKNILLGQFLSGSSSVGPKQRSVSDRRVSVINMFRLQESESSTDHVIGKLLSKNKIHAFIFILHLGHFTSNDTGRLEWLQKTFGESVLQFLMILFTYEKGGNGDTIIDDLKKNPVLEQLLEKCRGRYHICSKNMDVQSDMTTLLEKIDQMISENRQSCYTAEMYNIMLKLRRGLQDCRNEEHQRTGNAKFTEYDTQENTLQQVNVILLGKKGAGKSATGNTILGREAFSLKKNSKKVQKESVRIDGVNLDVYDIQGEYDPGTNMEDLTKNKVLSQLNESAPTVVLFVVKSEIGTKDEKRKVGISDRSRKYEKTIALIDNLPNWLRQNTWIIFTRGDELETAQLTIEELIEQTTELKRIIHKLRNRYHVFNNKAIKNLKIDQVIQLIKKIKETPLKKPPKITYFHRTIQPENDGDHAVRRIVLLGKTGAGKSATANTILGEKRFISELCSASVTAESEVELAVVGERKVTIVDTPGLFDTSMSAEDLAVEIGRCIYLSSPGPHAFLYVLQINIRFTEQEEEVVHKFEMMFGLEMRKYTIILFTQADQLEGKSPDSLIKKNKSLCRLVEQCGGFHVFNNKDLSNRDQVTELMEKIDRMVEKNGGSCYSNQMFEDAARIKQEEEERRRMEEEVRQREEQQRQLERERMKTEMEEAANKLKEMESKVTEQEGKLRDTELKEEETKSIKREGQESKLEKARLVEQGQLKEKNDQTSKKKLDDGFKKFFKKHENHLAAAGHVGSGRNVAIGAGVGVFLGAVLGGFIGILGGPPGIVLGAILGAGLGGAAGGALGGAIKTKQS